MYSFRSFAPVRRLAAKIVSEMTYLMSSSTQPCVCHYVCFACSRGEGNPGTEQPILRWTPCPRTLVWSDVIWQRRFIRLITSDLAEQLNGSGPCLKHDCIVRRHHELRACDLSYTAR